MAECLRFVRRRLSASTCPSQLQLNTNLNKSARQDVSLSDPAWNAQHGFGPGCSRPSDRTRARSGLFAPRLGIRQPEEKNTSEEKKLKGWGDCWTWTALDADSKLMLSWRLGPRDAAIAFDFMQDLAGRLASRVQLTTDGHKPYLAAVEDALGADIDYSMLIKLYGASGENETRYSPLWLHLAASHRRSRPEAHFDELYRTAESDDADVHAPLYLSDEQLLEKNWRTTRRRYTSC